MFNLSPLKILFIVVVITVLLGPDKLPDVANKIGRSWRSLQSFQGRIEKEVREAIPDLPNSQDLVRMARSPINLLNTLADRTEENQSIEMNSDSSESGNSLAVGTNFSNSITRESDFPFPIPSDPTLN